MFYKESNYSLIVNSRNSMKQFKFILSKEIKRLRTNASLTRIDLEKISGVSHKTISRIEAYTIDTSKEYSLENAYFIINALIKHYIDNPI